MAISKLPTQIKPRICHLFLNRKDLSCHNNLTRKFGNSHVTDDVITLGLILKIFYEKCYLVVVSNTSRYKIAKVIKL